MVIGRDEVFAVADALHAKGIEITNNLLKAELYSVYESGGNRNLVCDYFKEWRVINGIQTNNVKTPKQPASTSRPPATTKTLKPVPVDTTGDSIINKLPEPVRHSVLALVTAILTFIRYIQAQERDAATVLVEHERDQVRQQVVELENEVTRLYEDNERLQAALAAKQETVSADTILAVFTKFLAINAPALNLVTTPPELPITATTTPEPAVATKATRHVKKKRS